MSHWKNVAKIHAGILQSKTENIEELEGYTVDLFDILFSSTNNDYEQICHTRSCCCCNRCSHCLILLCLSTCRQLFVHERFIKSCVTFQRITELMREQFLQNLIKLLEKDRFVRYMAQKTLVTALQHPLFKEKEKTFTEHLIESFAEVCTDESITARLELFGYLLLDEIKYETRDGIADVLCTNWNILFEKCCISEKRNCFRLCEFLIIWQKLAKISTNINNFKTSERNQTILQNCPKLIDMLNELSPDEDFVGDKIIHLLNTVFCYGKSLSVLKEINPLYFEVAIKLLRWTNADTFECLPLGHNSWFGGKKYGHFDVPNENMSKIRIISLLYLKVIAVLLKFSQKIGFLNIDKLTMECVVLLDKFVASKITSKKPFDWLHIVFGDQDDDWMEALLAQLDIYLFGSKVWKTEMQSVKFKDLINPHQHFIMFIKAVDFDHSVLLDLLTSPETCFLLYLTRYIRLLVSQWEVFVQEVTGLEEYFVKSQNTEITGESGSFLKGSSIDLNNGMKITKYKSEEYFSKPSDCKVHKFDNNYSLCEESLNSTMHSHPFPEFLERKFKITSEGNWYDQDRYALQSLDSKFETQKKSGSDEKSTPCKTLGLALISNYDDDDDDDDGEEEEEVAYGHEYTQEIGSKTEKKDYDKEMKLDIIWEKIKIDIKKDEDGKKEEGFKNRLVEGSDNGSDVKYVKIEEKDITNDTLVNIFNTSTDKERKVVKGMKNSSRQSDDKVSRNNDVCTLDEYMTLDSQFASCSDKINSRDICAEKSDICKERINQSDICQDGSSKNAICSDTMYKNEVCIDGETNLLINTVHVDSDDNSEISENEINKFEFGPADVYIDSLLDRVMAMLIRLRLKIEGLWEYDLFPYNPTPLVSLIHQCENLYES